MPSGRVSFLPQLQKQVERAVALLTREIQRREAELARLVAQADLCRAAVDQRQVEPTAGRSPGGPAARKTTRGATRGVRRKVRGVRGAARVDWDEVLASVPATFGVADILEHPGARSRGRAQAYPALTRWQQAKKIKKVGTGRYQRL